MSQYWSQVEQELQQKLHVAVNTQDYSIIN